VALPRPRGAAGHVDALYRMLAGGLIAGLARLGVSATIGSERGAAGPACFAAAQGADLRVGDRKVCGSAQVQRGSAVLQHGSVLLDRLPFDELDLLLDPIGDTGADPTRAHRDLQARSVTLRELGAETAPALVAAALVEGFAAALDLNLESRVATTPST